MQTVEPLKGLHLTRIMVGTLVALLIVGAAWLDYASPIPYHVKVQAQALTKLKARAYGRQS
jgi:hypothetical protein